MDQFGEWTSEDFRVRVWQTDALLYMRLTGMVTPSAMYQAAAFAAGVAGQRPYAAVLVDMRRALILISEDDLPEFGPRSALTAKWRPGAYLIPEEHEPMFIRISWRFAQNGIERRIFTRAETALSWAREAATRARVRAALQASAAMMRETVRQEFAPSVPGEL